MSENSIYHSVVIQKEDNYADYIVPDVCIHCGESTTIKKDVLLRCQGTHWMVYVLIFLIAEMFETKLHITIPLCDKHKKSLDGLTIIKILLFIFGIPMIIAGIIVFFTASSGHNPTEDSLIGLGVFAAGIVLSWLFVSIVRKNRYFGVSIDEKHVKLVGVSSQFADALADTSNTIPNSPSELSSEREYGQPISKPYIQNIIENSGGEGEEIIITDYCPACGTKIKEDNRQCPECGLALAGEDT